MSLHKKISFELEICQHLAAHDWLYADGDAAGYDRAHALFPADVLAWVQAVRYKSRPRPTWRGWMPCECAQDAAHAFRSGLH